MIIYRFLGSNQWPCFLWLVWRKRMENLSETGNPGVDIWLWTQSIKISASCINIYQNIFIMKVALNNQINKMVWPVDVSQPSSISHHDTGTMGTWTDWPYCQRLRLHIGLIALTPTYKSWCSYYWHLWMLNLPVTETNIEPQIWNCSFRRPTWSLKCKSVTLVSFHLGCASDLSKQE